MREFCCLRSWKKKFGTKRVKTRSEEHTSELQSPCNLVCRLLLEKKKQKNNSTRLKYKTLRKYNMKFRDKNSRKKNNVKIQLRKATDTTLQECATVRYDDRSTRRQ